MYYAGIGSRECPGDIGLMMMKLGFHLERAGFILRSGAARGADTFFESGVQHDSNKEIFIHRNRLRDGRCHDPSKGLYNAQKYSNYAEAVQLASEVHPAWNKCDQVAREMHARNVYQVLGPDMAPESYSSWLICWAIPDIHGVPEGGTRTAWKIAERYKIPRYNLAVRDDREKVMIWLESRMAA